MAQALCVVAAALTRVLLWQLAQPVVETWTRELWLGVCAECVASHEPVWQVTQVPGADLPAARLSSAPLVAL